MVIGRPQPLPLVAPPATASMPIMYLPQVVVTGLPTRLILKRMLDASLVTSTELMSRLELPENSSPVASGMTAAEADAAKTRPAATDAAARIPFRYDIALPLRKDTF